MKVMEWGEFDVTEDRSNFIGGSDIPVIMGISPFKRRFDLLLEKAGLQERSFTGNKYTEYGNIIEPQIREFINRVYVMDFIPNRVVDGDIRYHSDGYSAKGCVLEVKSTSSVYPTVDDYKMYLVQLIKGMEENDAQNGLLAVYERPEDLNPEFDPKRLQVFQIHMKGYQKLLEKVNYEIDRFRKDLARLKENPLLTEIDFLPENTSIVTIANQVVAFEKQLAAIKEVEQKCKEAKKQLYQEMMKHGVKSLNTPNGTKISVVEESPGTTKTVTEFDLERLKSEYPAAYTHCMREVEKTTPGRSGYVRITVPKG